jgi:DNA polymerase
VTKETALKQIALEIENLSESPLYEYRVTNDYLAVPGEGDPDAKILFIGEAPGEKEAISGRPFVGRAGKSLDALLEKNGLRRKDVFITNIVKDRPPANRAPSKAEIKLYAPFLIQQINILQPKLIATLGRFSMTFALSHFDLPSKGKSIGDLHGVALKAQANFGEVTIFPLYHPAAVFYNRKLEPLLDKDFSRLIELSQEV